MKSFILASLLAGVFGQNAAKPDVGSFLRKFDEITGRNASQKSPVGLRIFDASGVNAVNPRFKYPFLGFIRIDRHSDQEYLCSGTLLDSQTLLTSAHCVTQDFVRFFKAYFHRHNKRLTSKSEGGTEHRFNRVYAHEGYQYNNGIPLNDIALVRLATRVPSTNSKLNYVRLPSPKLGNPPSDVELKIAGWGSTKPNGQQSDILQESQSVHLTNKCYTKASGLNKDQHLCATNSGSAHACPNDSGGPLLAPATDDGYIQIGLIPAQPTCGRSNKPG
ncbi:hypothetical protein L0F63_005609, partial [Massospora cicadina]